LSNKNTNFTKPERKKESDPETKKYKLGINDQSQILPDNTISPSTDWANGRHVLCGDLEQVPVHIVLRVSTTMRKHPFDRTSRCSRARLLGSHIQRPKFEVQSSKLKAQSSAPTYEAPPIFFFLCFFYWLFLSPKTHNWVLVAKIWQSVNAMHQHKVPLFRSFSSENGPKIREVNETFFN
jgi:hypothetical protein